MGRKTNMQRIDSSKLRAELKQRGLAMKEASEIMGFSITYIKNRLDIGTMPEPSIKLIEHCFGIKPEKYVVKEEKPVESAEKVEKVELVFDHEALYKIINNAVYNAVYRALGGEQ